MRLEITKTEHSQKNPGIVIITGNDNKRYSGFAIGLDKNPTGLADLKVGDVIDAEITDKGGFKNIYKFTKLDTVPLPPTGTTGSSQAPQTAPAPKQVEVSGPEHGMALKMIGDLYIAGKLKEVEPLVTKMWAELYRIIGVQK